MSITLRLNTEVEHRLRGEAAKNGLTVEEYLEQLAARAIASDPLGSVTSSEAWETLWRVWAASHNPLSSTADDDRDAIYAGRGE